jgi:glucose-1-phosphate thymidylyltransferase
MKGIILAGGRGTRMQPQTLIHNKHLLSVYVDDKAIPMIWFPLYTLKRSGCKEILIVSSQEHSGDIIEFLGDGSKFGVDLTYKIQDHNDPARPVGIASAMKLIKGFVKDEPFAVILGDNFYEDEFSKEFAAYEEKYNSVRFSSNPNDHAFAHIFLKSVDDPARFGVATVDNNGKVVEIIEKPKEPKSNLAVTGLYLFNWSVFEIIKTLKPSNRGELEVSEINDHYVKNGAISSSVLSGFWSDLGIPSSMHRSMDYMNKINYKISWE